MKIDEMEIIRALSVDLGDGIVMVLSYQYHTEKDPTDPAGKKNDRSKSRYRMLGFVDLKENVEKKIRTLHSDRYRILPWKWENDPNWNGSILYMKDASNECQSNWLRLKLKKAVTPEIGQALLRGYKKDTDPKSRTFGKYVAFTPNAVYDTAEYECSDGTFVNVDDFETMKTKVGQNFWKELKMKLTGPNAFGSRSADRNAVGFKPYAGHGAFGEPEIVRTA